MVSTNREDLQCESNIVVEVTVHPRHVASNDHANDEWESCDPDAPKEPMSWNQIRDQ